MSETVNETPVVVGIGELLWDCFPDSRRPGGAPANVAFHATQLGLRGGVCTRVGSDDDGDALVDHLRSHGLDPQFVQRDTEHPTGTVEVHVGPGAGPRYTIHELVAWDFLDFTSTWRDLFRSVDAVCYGTLAQRSQISRDTIRRALDATPPHALCVYDVNLRPPFVDRNWIVASLRRANIIKLNEHELPTLLSAADIEPTADYAALHKLVEAFCCSALFLTRGAAGCTVASRDALHEVPAEPVQVVDSVGAGDAFTAGLVYGLLHDWSPETTARFANAVGGIVASMAGAMPRTREQLSKLKQAFPTTAH